MFDRLLNTPLTNALKQTMRSRAKFNHSQNSLHSIRHTEAALQRCSENVEQNYRRTAMPKCDFNIIDIALWHRCSPVNLLDIFRTHFPKNTFEGLPIRWIS